MNNKVDLTRPKKTTHCKSRELFSKSADQKDLGIISFDDLTWTDLIERRCAAKAMKIFYLIKSSSSLNITQERKLETYCSYIMTVLKHCSQVYRDSRTSLRSMECIQRKVTLWILIDTSEEYTARLKILKILPVSLYLEMHQFF